MQLVKHDVEVRLASSAHMYQHSVAAALTDSDVQAPSRPHALTPSRPHALTPSRPHALTPSHPHTLTPSHPHTLTPSHPHTLTPSHPHTLTPSRPHAHNLATNLFKKVLIQGCMCPVQCNELQTSTTICVWRWDFRRSAWRRAVRVLLHTSRQYLVVSKYKTKDKKRREMKQDIKRNEEEKEKYRIQL